MSTFLLRLGVLLAWGTLFFMPKKSIKRYMPVTILSALITVTVTFVGVHYDFWKVKGNTSRRMWNLLTLVLGLFPLGCIWIFHLTFGKFWAYIIVNFINNIAYAYPMISFLEKIKYIKYSKFTRIHHIIVTMLYSLFLYKYQMIYDKKPRK